MCNVIVIDYIGFMNDNPSEAVEENVFCCRARIFAAKDNLVNGLQHLQLKIGISTYKTSQASVVILYTRDEYDIAPN